MGLSLSLGFGVEVGLGVGVELRMRLGVEAWVWGLGVRSQGWGPTLVWMMSGRPSPSSIIFFEYRCASHFGSCLSVCAAAARNAL